jgi:hypothetical protein
VGLTHEQNLGWSQLVSQVVYNNVYSYLSSIA